jgi:enoyl-CoA hydratase/carnithine racemase
MTDQSSQLLTRRDGHVAEIVFNNPARLNAMTLHMWSGLSQHLAACAEDDDVRVVVLSGAGGRAFVSGADISEFDSQRGSADAVAHYNDVSEAAEQAVADFPKPIIAAIDGYCLGGGVGIAIGCDIRIASDASAFGIPAGRLGLGYAYDGVAKLISVIGPAATAELFMTGNRIDADAALRIGLVSQVIPKADFQKASTDFATTIAANAPLTLRAFKAALIEHRKDPQHRDKAHVAALVAECYASEDYAEGRAAFAAKRPPTFKGS